jgi:hypothetical protein
VTLRHPLLLASIALLSPHENARLHADVKKGDGHCMRATDASLEEARRRGYYPYTVCC